MILKKFAFQAKRISRKRIEYAMKPLAWTGLVYEGRTKFWNNVIPVIESYLSSSLIKTSQLKSFVSFARRLGLIESRSELSTSGKYYCDRLETTVVSPCQEKTCPHWGNLPQRLNCTKYHLTVQEKESMSVADMAIFSGYSRQHVNTVLNTALSRMRNKATQVTKEEIIDHSINPVTIDGVCQACGEETNLPSGFFHSSLDNKHRYTYCGFKCYVSKRPVVIELEQKFGIAVDKVIRHLARQYSSLAEAADCLSVSEPLLLAIVKDYDPKNPLLKSREDDTILVPRVKNIRGWNRMGDKLQETIEKLHDQPN